MSKDQRIAYQNIMAEPNTPPVVKSLGRGETIALSLNL